MRQVNSDRGVMVYPLVLFTAVALAILALAMSKSLQSRALQSTYLQGMEVTYRLVETGLSDAIGRLVYDPNPQNFNTSWVQVPAEKGQYRNMVSTRTLPVDPIYYIITSASRTVSGKAYSIRLHSYARVVNVASYFIAMNDPAGVTVSDGADISQGMIYAPALYFVTGQSPNPTRVKAAQYVTSCTPPTPWSVATKAEIIITSPSNNEPEKLTNKLTLPQILYSDIARYKSLAGPHTTKNNFVGDIFPPGYAGTQDLLDSYPGHTSNNLDHIYYSDLPITITSATVHGQVLFVSPEDIHIASFLVSAADAEPLPGAGVEPSSSTAHQAVLISKKNVVLDAVLAANTTLNIQALIMAPNGTLLPVSYGDAVLEATLSLNFNGSLIVSTLNSSPKLPEVFRLSRTYSYMNSLQTNPPPYLPAIAEIFYSLEQRM